MAIAAGVTALATAASPAVGATEHRTPLQQGLAFYRGATITFIAPTSAGSPNDLVSRAVTQAMGAYLHATINVENIPTGGFIPGQDALAASNPNGLTIGFFNLASDYYDLVTNQPGLNFNPLREVFLGGHPNITSEIITTAGSPYTSFASLLAATPSNPAKILATSGAALSTTELLTRTFGIDAQFISYANTAALVAGFVRGDSTLAATPYANFTTQLNTGAYRDLVNLTTSPLPHADPGYAVLSTAPTVAQLLKKYPPKTAAERRDAKLFAALESIPGYVIGAPTRVKADEVAALDAAAKSALSSPAITAAIVTANNAPGYVSPTADKIIYADALDSAKAIANAIGS